MPEYYSYTAHTLSTSTPPADTIRSSANGSHNNLIDVTKTMRWFSSISVSGPTCATKTDNSYGTSTFANTCQASIVFAIRLIRRYTFSP